MRGYLVWGNEGCENSGWEGGEMGDGIGWDRTRMSRKWVLFFVRRGIAGKEGADEAMR